MKKILVVSDLHLTDKFDENKFRYLCNLFEKYNELILLGDFWSYYSVTFEEFVNSKWKVLFPLMLQKNCKYIIGNHDRKEWLTHKVLELSHHIMDEYTIELENYTLKLQHGHKITGDSITNDVYTKVMRKSRLDTVNYKLQEILIKRMGESASSLFGLRTNQKLKEFSTSLNENTILVTGHSHAAEYDLENRFINTGFINFGYSSYLEITDHEFKLIKENY